MIIGIRKIFLTILIFVFFLANVSFTVVLHYCEMMKQTSKTECGMCEVEDDITSTNVYSLSISNIDNQSCCQNFVKSTDQIDNVILKKSDSNEIKDIQYFSIIILNSEILVHSSSFYTTHTHSPPEKNPVYLVNSILLI